MEGSHLYYLLGGLANGVISGSYLVIALIIARGILKTRQVRTNPLAVATAGIFFTCGVHHGGHVLQLLIPINQFPLLYFDDRYALARMAWDMLGAGVAVYYFTLRSRYGVLLGGQVALFDDVKERQKKHHLEKAAVTDSLTGLANHRHAQEVLRREVEKAAQNHHPLSVLMIDLDNFKEINDARGHLVGDRILANVGATLRDELRDFDRASRYGGDEFLVVLPDTDRASAALVASRLETRMRQAVPDLDFVLKCSIGISMYPDDSQDPRRLLDHADEAMYYAKRIGGGQAWLSNEVVRTDERDPERLNRMVSAATAATVRSLMSALREHDASTADHSERVSRYAVNLGERIDFPYDDLAILRLAALLHDVGKTSVPSELLQKPSRLTADEYDLVKKHADAGYQMLRTIPSFKSAAVYVRYHHEGFGGHGYPEGLVATEIPLASRIVLVADALDSMVSDRPYRKAMSVKESVAALWRGSGTQFDPQLVEAMVELIDGGVVQQVSSTTPSFEQTLEWLGFQAQPIGVES